jgi:hypothetical protein
MVDLSIVMLNYQRVAGNFPGFSPTVLSAAHTEHGYFEDPAGRQPCRDI